MQRGTEQPNWGGPVMTDERGGGVFGSDGVGNESPVPDLKTNPR